MQQIDETTNRAAKERMHAGNLKMESTKQREMTVYSLQPVCVGSCDHCLIGTAALHTGNNSGHGD